MKKFIKTPKQWFALCKSTGVHLCGALFGIVLIVLCGVVSSVLWLCRQVKRIAERYPLQTCLVLSIVFAVLLTLAYAQMKVTATTLTYQRDSLQIQVDSIKTRFGINGVQKYK